MVSIDLGPFVVECTDRQCGGSYNNRGNTEGPGNLAFHVVEYFISTMLLYGAVSRWISAMHLPLCYLLMFRTVVGGTKEFIESCVPEWTSSSLDLTVDFD